jgi:tetratricopeptide (TPR) repeat protein
MRGAMIGHFNLGDILLQDEQYELAEKELQLALDMARKRKLVIAEIRSGLYLVEAKIALSHLDNVEDELNNLKTLISSQESPCFSGEEFVLRASLHWKQGQVEKAREYFESAFTLLEDENCQYERARAYLAIASFLKDQGQIKEAKNALQKGKELFSVLDNELGLQIIEKTSNLLN